MRKNLEDQKVDTYYQKFVALGISPNYALSLALDYNARNGNLEEMREDFAKVYEACVEVGDVIGAADARTTSGLISGLLSL